MKRLTIYEPVEFSPESRTERGERVYTSVRFRVDPKICHLERVLPCDKGIGITEEWIEDAIVGCLSALEKDFPYVKFSVVRIAPNDIFFTSGTVQ